MSALTHKEKFQDLITNSNPMSSISEAYRALRTNITFSSIDQDLKKILVTSSIPGEGKTTTVANLAVVYAQENKKVLIIDADLRRPSIHQRFVRSNRLGLTNILVNQYKALDVILETDIPNLSIITSGSIPPNPSELLSSAKLASILEELHDKFDLILIDSPPTLAVADSQILSTMCDGVLFVVNHGKVKRQLAKKALLNLEHVKAKVLGVVINNQPKKKNKDFYYNY
ncbi:CpsD/CapB family tyrosine-protein kinase [Paenibacillus sp. GCM10027628]|uniref:CpsD/CapB family tyrosine-protein kinase n=1 Tax=Paenibacillus sp. GCM10027628 TaxID=3273413 RepID=UPI00363DAB16